MSDPWLFTLIALAGLSVFFVLLWLIELKTLDASLVDAGWAFGIGAAGILFLLVGDGDSTRRLVAGILVGVWSARLTWHLVSDRVIGKPEDGRYRALRAHWGKHAHRNFFAFFQAQALLATFFAVPLLILAYDGKPFGCVTDYIGIGIWLVAIIGEGIADHQLARWRANPEHQGITCRAGLWRYSRHPNYFFEWLLWFSYVFLALGSSFWWASLIVPALLLFLLLKVTGIPYTEMRALKSRGDDYRAYQRTTSAFFPWFPRTDPLLADPSMKAAIP